MDRVLIDRLRTLVSALCLESDIGLEVAKDRWAWDPVRRVIYIAGDDLERIGVDACAGIVAHEVSHYFITRAFLFPAPFPSVQARHMLVNCIEDPRVNTWIIQRFPGVRPWLTSAHNAHLDPEERPVLPDFISFGLECAAEEGRGWRTAPPHTAACLSARVREALDQTRAARKAYATRLPDPSLIPRPSAAEVTRRYQLEVAPRLPGTAGRLTPLPHEQVVRLSAMEAIDLAVREIFPIAEQLLEADVQSVAEHLAGDQATREQVDLLLDGDDLRGLLGVYQGCRGGGRPSEDDIAQARRILEAIIDGVGKPQGKQLQILPAAGPGAGTIMVVAPARARRRSMSTSQPPPPPSHHKPPLQLPKATQGDYDQVLDQVSDQVERLSERFLRILAPRKRLGERSGYPSGQRLDLKRVLAFEADPRRYNELWRRKTIPERRHAAVLLLIDLSGSMSGDRIEAALAGTVLLVETLRHARIPFAAYGFQDVLIPFCEFNDRLTETHQQALMDMRSEVEGTRDGGNNQPLYNDDGPCLSHAAEILLDHAASDPILIAVSDGLPEGSHSDTDDLHAVVQRLTTSTHALELIGVGLGPNTEHVLEFYPNAIANVPLESFADALGDLLEQRLLGAP